MSTKSGAPDLRNAQATALFAALRLEAPAISRATRVPIEDVEQEMMLMCLEVVQTVSHYDPRRGSLRPWLIVRAWRWARRWRGAHARAENSDPDGDCESAGGGSCVPAIDELLIEEEVRRAHEQSLESAYQRREGGADPRTAFEILAIEHWSEREAVKWCGGSRKMARHAKRRAARLQAAGLPYSEGDHHATVR